jgi:hypothetical protein
VIEPDEAALRLKPAAAARFLVALTFSATRHDLGALDEEPLDSDGLVALLLDGLLVRAPHTEASDPTAKKDPI